MLRLTLAGRSRLAALLTLGVLTASACAQLSLTKLVDFGGIIGGATDPYSSPILIGNELWFTTNAGGSTGFGTISKYNLSTNTVSVMYSMDLSGNTPFGKLTQVGDLLYYTTSANGTGGRGTISVFNMATNTNTVLYNSPTNGTGVPTGLHGGVAYVDRGDGTASLYALHQNGGITNANGGVLKLTLNLADLTATSTLLATMPESTTTGRQPWEGFTRVGNTLYFTMANGGPTLAGAYAGGAGAIGTIDITNDAVNTGFKMLDGGDGSSALPMGDLTYDPATNALYMVTNGSATQPGALVKIGLDGTQTTLYELTGGSTSGYPDGRFGSGDVVVIEGKVYFVTWQGGTGSAGVISQFDLTTNQYVKLFDLSNDKADNFGGEVHGGLYSVRDTITGEYDVYFMGKQGGVNDEGTLARFHLVPEPQTAVLCLTGLLTLGLSRRRREEVCHE